MLSLQKKSHKFCTSICKTQTKMLICPHCGRNNFKTQHGLTQHQKNTQKCSASMCNECGTCHNVVHPHNNIVAQQLILTQGCKDSCALRPRHAATWTLMASTLLPHSIGGIKTPFKKLTHQKRLLPMLTRLTKQKTMPPTNILNIRTTDASAPLVHTLFDLLVQQQFIFSFPTGCINDSA